MRDIISPVAGGRCVSQRVKKRHPLEQTSDKVATRRLTTDACFYYVSSGFSERPVTDGRFDVSRRQPDVPGASAAAAEQSQPHQQKSADHGRECSTAQRLERLPAQPEQLR